jgi:ABC-type phosphate/phosphonate transport system substrate-binding protein
MSGWVLPVGSGLPLDRVGEIVELGAHRTSLEALMAGEVDVAPIDAHVLAATVLTEPAFGDLPVLAQYGPSPSPPIVLTGGDGERAASLRAELAGLHAAPEGAAALALGAIERLDAVDDAFYAPTRDCDRRAALCTR